MNDNGVMSEEKFQEIYGIPKTGQGRAFEELIHNADFQDYYKTLNSMPFYTKLSKKDRDDFDEFCKPMLKMSLTIAKKHPFLWGKWACGINPYDYQFKMLDDMKNYKFFIGNTARQIGKSLVLGIFSFWAAYNNVHPVGIDKRTKVGIVSATEDQAKKLLRDIYMIVQNADGVFAKLTKGTQFSSRQYFTEKMREKPTAYKLDFTGGTIECFPPTKKLRGNSLSFLFIDEGDFLGCEDPNYFFNSEAMPTLKKTEGNCNIYSTPKGTPSYYRDIFRPEEPEPATGWHRIWYNWTIYQDDWVNGWSKYLQAVEQGKLMDFEAEFEAKFTSGRHSFFNPEKIDKCVANRGPIDECIERVYAGIDFSGGGACRTAVSFSYYDNKEIKSVLLKSKEFPMGYDNSQLVSYFKQQRLRYNIYALVCEKCPAGETPIALLKQAGFRVIEFNSRADKVSSYMNLEIAVNNERIELYKDKTVLAQLKGLESIETNMGNIQIKKPNGMNDDVADSVMFSMSEFVKPKRKGTRRIL